jgi:hypothetical protein
LARLIGEWQANPEPGTLQAFERPDGALAILDTRSRAVRSTVLLRGLDKAVYDYCDCVRPLSAIGGHVAKLVPRGKVEENALKRYLEVLIAHGYMLGDSSGYLSLALRPPGNGPDSRITPAQAESQRPALAEALPP